MAEKVLKTRRRPAAAMATPVPKSLTKGDVLKEAKRLDLFVYNKAYRQYEIIVPVSDYEKI